jgi:hypothetical protein
MTERFLIESFWQTASNCVSIVLIKAAFLRYGFDNVFKLERINDHFVITLKNGKMLTLSAVEIRRINKDNKISFRRFRDVKKKLIIDRIKEHVALCFAVIVRNVQLNGYHGTEYTETAAITELTKKGMETDHMHSLLGLKRKQKTAQKLSVSHLGLFKKKKAVLLYSKDHIVVVSKGMYEDFGNVMNIGAEIPEFRGKKAEYWFELK